MGKTQFSILGDSPVDVTKDTLNFRSFVQPFSERLIQSVANTPFTVGIYADWGQGKTTVMRMLQHFLDERRCVTVWFEPWKYNTRDAVWKGLALTLAVQIRAQQTLLKEYRRKQPGLKVLAAEFLTSRVIGSEWAAKVVKAIETEPWSPTLLHEFESNLATLFESIAPTTDDPDARPVVLFVDDLDRCLPEAALAVLEALKLVLNRRGLITIMGIAEEELTRAVAAAYAKELAAIKPEYDPDWGRKYIQKIIQMPFPLPVVTERSFETYVEDCLTASRVKDELGDTERWCGLIRDTCGGNLREVKRFINTFISEVDKASANATVVDAPSFDARRVAFILLLAWYRFRPFLEHVRRQVADPELLIRYQLFFSASSPLDVAALRDTGKTFHEDPALRRLFTICFDPVSAAAPPLVTPFSNSADLEPYLQFGKRRGPPPAPPPAAPPGGSGAPEGVEAPSGPREEIAQLLSEARSQFAAGFSDEAAARLRDAEKRAREVQDEHGLGLVLVQLALVQEARGDHAAALELLGGALTSVRKIHDRPAELTALLQLGRLYGATGDSRDLETLGKAQAIATELQDRLSQITVALEIGAARARRGGVDDAEKAFLEALGVAQELGHVPGEVGALSRLGELRARRGRHPEAAADFQQAAQRAQRLGERAIGARLLRRVGEEQTLAGQPPAATKSLEEALATARDLRDDKETAGVLLALSAARRALGTPDWGLLSEARSLGSPLRDPVLDLRIELEAAAFKVSSGENAADSYRHVLEEARRLRDDDLELEALLALAGSGGDRAEALRHYEEARWIAARRADQPTLLQISKRIAALLHGSGRHGAEDKELVEAIRLSELLADAAGTAALWRERANNQENLGELTAATESYEKAREIYRTLNDRESGVAITEDLARVSEKIDQKRP